MGWKILIALICVAANALFVAAEFSFVKVRPTQLRVLADKGDSRAVIMLHIHEELSRYLSATQVGITLASLGLGWVGEPAIAELVGPVVKWAGVQSPNLMHGISFFIAFGIMSTVHIVLGEQAPKSLSIQRAEQVALLLASPMRVFYWISYPFLIALDWLSKMALLLVGMKLVDEEESLSPDEIRLVVASGKLDPQQRELMERVLRSTHLPIRSVMVPRTEMKTVSLLDSPDDIVTFMKKNGFSRVPVTRDRDPDHIIGYIHVKDLFLEENIPKGGLRSLCRDILFVPESRSTGKVMEDFKRTRIPIAVVVDEYGGTSGLATMEDVLEEIVGEIHDEFDEDKHETAEIEEKDDGTYIVDGLVSVVSLEQLGIQVEPIEGHDSLGGYITARLERLARPGDAIDLGNYEAVVEDVRNRRVRRVRLIPKKQEENSTHPPPPSS